MRKHSGGHSDMTRRHVLRNMVVLLGAASVAPLLNACRRIVPAAPDAPHATATATKVRPTHEAAAVDRSETEQPTETVSPGVTTVALVNTTDRSAGVRRAADILGVPLLAGRSVLVKPNFNSAHPAPGSTHPDVLRAIVELLQDRGAGVITVGDRSGMGTTTEVMRELGVLDLAQEAGLDVVSFDELPDDDWIVVREPGHHWSRGFPVPRLLQEAGVVVQTCNLKTHRHGGHFTMSLKNSIGLVAKHHAGYDFMDELHDSEHQRTMIAEANSAYVPDLIVLDGVEAFVKGGPDTGTHAATEVILAGTDRVAIDAVGVAILRLFGTTEEVSRGAVFEQEQIARAVELDLGVSAADKIRIVSDDAAGTAYAARVMDELLA